MKLKLKILLISLAITIVTVSVISTIMEYSISLKTKREIALEEKEAREKAKTEEALESEKEYEKEMLIKALNRYDVVGEYYNGLALVKRNDKYGYIDKNGEEIIPTQYDLANNFKGGYSKVKKGEKWGYINTVGDELIPIEYSYCGDVYCDNVAVGNGGKYGFMSIQGKEITPLMYDKVMAFDPSNETAKVVLNKKYGYIDKNGKEMIAISADYEEENENFEGQWNQTDIHSSKAGTIVITSQIATSFNFEVSSKYFSNTGKILGTANIVEPNVAEYEYNSGEKADLITFSIVDGMLDVKAKNDGNCGMENNLSVIGTYTLSEPKYTNANAISKLFSDDENLFDRIKETLGEDLYEGYFLYGFNNGEYKVKDLNGAENIIKGILYTVTIPTIEKDFKLLISKEYVYFYAKYDDIYRTNDENRKSQTKMPSAIAFDDL